MSRNKIFEDICVAFVKLDSFNYTYKEFNNLYEKIKEKEKLKKKNEKKNEKEKYKNIELDNYRNFILHYRNNGFDIKTTLELWNKHLHKLK
jgi:hypothetical protein